MKTLFQMRSVLQAFCKNAGSQAQAARLLKISRAHVSDMLRGRRDISENIARKLGYRRVVMYEEVK